MRGTLRLSAMGALCLSAFASLAACSKAASGPVVTVHTARGDSAVAVELAMTRESQARGLMYRTELDEDAGMLFVFEDEAERHFWMSNTPIPLDIIYVKGDATILSIAENTTPYSEKMIPSRGPVRYVLEVRGGWSQRHGAKPGDKLTLPGLADAKAAGLCHRGQSPDLKRASFRKISASGARPGRRPTSLRQDQLSQ